MDTATLMPFADLARSSIGRCRKCSYVDPMYMSPPSIVCSVVNESRGFAAWVLLMQISIGEKFTAAEGYFEKIWREGDFACILYVMDGRGEFREKERVVLKIRRHGDRWTTWDFAGDVRKSVDLEVKVTLDGLRGAKISNEKYSIEAQVED